MAYTQASNKAVQRYSKKTYDQLAIRLKKGDRERYKEYAAQRGMSLASYIISLIEKDNEGK